VKELLRPHANHPVSVDAKEVFQPINPRDGLITKLEILGPSVETTSAKFGKPPLLEDLSLKAFANFSARSGPDLILQLRNIGNLKRGVDMQALGPTLLAMKQGTECFDQSDGPSFVAVTRTDFMNQYPTGGGCVVNGRAFVCGCHQGYQFQGPPSRGSGNEERAELVNDKFPGNEFAEDATYISEGGYRITYLPDALNGDGKITTYLLSVRPLEFGKTGRRNFVIDETGVVHSTDENRAASQIRLELKRNR
jgi:hypothetical protein